MASESPKAKHNGKPRRSVVRVRERSFSQRVRGLMDHPTLGWGVIVGLALTMVVTTLAIWAREHPLVDVGQVMSKTRTVRVPFATVDQQATEQERDSARQRVARVYVADEAALDEIGTSLMNLPGSVAGIDSLEAVQDTIRERFGLSEDKLAAVRALAADETGLVRWRARVGELVEILRRRPLMDAATFQGALQEGLNGRIELRHAEGTRLVSRDTEPINIDDAAQLETATRRIAGIVGFDETLTDLVVHRIVQSPRATYAFDPEATEAQRESAASGVRPVRREYAVGQTIFTRGDVLNESQLALFRRELAEFHNTAGTTRVWTGRVALFVTMLGLTAFLSGYLGAMCPRVVQRTARMSWISLLVGGAVGLSAALTVLDPRLVMLVVPGSVVLVAVLMRVAYDRVTAGVIAGVCAVMACLATDRSIGVLAVCLVGIAMAIGALAEVRDRREIIRMSFLTAVVLCIASALAGLIDRPMTEFAGAALRQTLVEGALGALAGLAVGGITMFALPFVERAFDITTGMTLIELRDPKQPLLREMQQRAPGTYNHSLNVASIAESAAESIGADSLLTYVGCLYHDIGKITKPEYFVENQRGGENRHDKLSPAMSLLVIIGHVKDGVEMAREHGLPPQIVHFIEAHHGTTLVEFFYRRARDKVKPEGEDQAPVADDERLPDEVDYRYPGPRPRTKEVAITMLSDAVESATRTLPEPTPARIEALVRQLAQQRLMDGQFDECDLTLAEVRTICDSISKTVASIYHGRISYTGDKKPKPESKPADGADAPAEKSA